MYSFLPNLNYYVRDIEDTTVTTRIPTTMTWGDDDHRSLYHGTYEQEKDISGEIQKRLDASLEVVLPAGLFYIDTPLVTPYRSGGCMRGAGRTDVLIADDVVRSDGSVLAGLSTRLIYRGDLTEPMLKIRGSEFNLSNITFLSAVPNASAATSITAGSIGLLITDEGTPGLGSGKHDVHGCGFYGWDSGVQFGVLEGDYNNDMCNFTRCTFRNCTNAVHSISKFAVSNTFSHCQFRHEIVKTFKIAGGGHLKVRDCTITHAQILFYFSSDNPEVSRPGKNTRLFVCTDLKVDSQAFDSDTPESNFKYCDTAKGAGNQGRVVIIRPQCSASNNWIEGRMDDGGQDFLEPFTQTFTLENPSYNTINSVSMDIQNANTTNKEGWAAELVL